MSYRDRTLKWLERQSDRNLLRQYKNRLKDIPNSQKRGLKDKGYLKLSFNERKLYITERGEQLLEQEKEPPYPLI
ncbi:MAG: hypothetical protein ACLFVP_07270 [Candidatus Bathyarchaeia archaeon]